MKKLVATVAISALGLCFANSVQARPQYFENFKGAYPDIKEAADLKCGVCHGEKGAKKKIVSDYAKELGTALGAKDVKDADAIKKALKAVEAKEAEKGKTYGDILKGGKLPAPAP